MSGTLDDHIPDNGAPRLTRADHVPCQPCEDFFADQVPSRTTRLLSLKRVQEPLAALCVEGRRTCPPATSKRVGGPGCRHPDATPRYCIPIRRSFLSCCERGEQYPDYPEPPTKARESPHFSDRRHRKTIPVGGVPRTCSSRATAPAQTQPTHPPPKRLIPVANTA